MAKVLVVDDDKDMLTLVSSVLNRSGHSVKTEYKWENTLDDIETFDPQVVLLDVMLGNGDGRDISKLIKSNKRFNHIPVILISGVQGINTNPTDSFHDDFMAKPFSRADLVEKIRHHSEQSSLQKIISSDKQLLVMFVSDPGKAVSYCYDEYASIIYGYILSIVKETEQSQNILKNVFHDILQTNHEYNSNRESFLIWCIGIANRAINKEMPLIVFPFLRADPRTVRT